MSLKGIYKLHNTIDTRRLARKFVDKNIGWVHVLQSQSVGNVVHSLPLPVVAESFFANHSVNLLFHCQTQTAYVRLGEDDAQKAVAVAGESDDLMAVSGKRLLCRAMASRAFCVVE